MIVYKNGGSEILRIEYVFIERFVTGGLSR